MRRRIYIDPEGSLSDNTSRPYLYDLDHDDSPLEWCCTGALYKDALWEQYQAAVAEESRLRRLVCEALKAEPYDTVERDLATRAKEFLDSNNDGFYAVGELDKLGAAAVAHAATLKETQ